ncbi:MAG: hypothetical protein JEZ03_16160 [Bacteroidales bacterium]|nr:hypothetical protein [Bacteroidales bacterium]
MIKLSKEHRATIPFKVNFENIPQDKLLINQPKSYVYVDVDATGSDLIGLKYFKHRPEININLSEQLYLRSGNHTKVNIPVTQVLNLNSVRNEFYANIIDVSPDTLYFEFENLYRKKLAVKTDISYKLKSQHFLMDDPVVSPDSIIVNGREEFISGINNIETESVKFLDLDKDVNQDIKLIIPQGLDKKNLSDEHVSLKMQVQKFTEIEQTRNVDVFNLPDAYSIKLFPEQVKIIYRVAIRDYQNIDPEQFQLNVDYGDVIEQKSRILDVHISHQPDQVQIVSIIPSQVEYIIVKEDD